MQSKAFTFVMTVVVAVFIGVTLAVQQMNKPILKRLVQQQDEILRLQKKTQHVLETLTPSSAPFQDATAEASKVSTGDKGDITERLLGVEKQIANLTALVRSLKTNQPPRRQGPPPEDYTKVYEIPVDGSPVKGPADAPVTIVEFLDFQCPFCARFHPVLDEVLAAYPDKVRYVLKNFPLRFHPQAASAAKAALAAGEQGKYFEMAGILLKNQRQLTEDNFKKWAGELGLDVDKFWKDYKNDAKWTKIIQKDIALGNKVNVRGTPTFYLNGRKTRARDLTSYKREIDAILKKSGKGQ